MSAVRPMGCCPMSRAKLKDRRGAVGKEKVISDKCGRRRNLRRDPGGAKKWGERLRV